MFFLPYRVYFLSLLLIRQRCSTQALEGAPSCRLRRRRRRALPGRSGSRQQLIFEFGRTIGFASLGPGRGSLLRGSLTIQEHRETLILLLASLFGPHEKVETFSSLVVGEQKTDVSGGELDGRSSYSRAWQRSRQGARPQRLALLLRSLETTRDPGRLESLEAFGVMILVLEDIVGA